MFYLEKWLTIISGSLNTMEKIFKIFQLKKELQKGIFLAFQYPLEIPGVKHNKFLKTSLNTIEKLKVKKE